MYISGICHYGKELAGQAIYLLLNVCDMEYKVSAKPKVDAVVG